MIKKLLGTLLIILIPFACWAIPADPTPRKIQQPDGTFVTLKLHGDEYLNYTTTADGFTVVKDEHGYWVYASKQADGSLAATDVVAHDEPDRLAEEKAFLDSTPQRIKPQMSSRKAEMRQNNRVRRAQALQQRRAAELDYSKFRGLIILVEFNDRPFMYGDEMNSIMNDIANKENYKGDSRTNYVNESRGFDCRYYGSIYDYFRDNSNSKFLPKFDIVGPVKMNYSQYYTENNFDITVQLFREALDAVDSQVDFSQYDGDGDGEADMVYFIYAGLSSHYNGADSRLIWPHEYVLYQELDEEGHIAKFVEKDGVRVYRYACNNERAYDDDISMLAGIGNFCHEFSHVLGLPDLYDTDYEGSGGVSAHPDMWSVMANGCDLNNEYVPCNYSLFERYLVGFCDKPTILNEEGTYAMHAVSTNEGFWLESPVDDEFFIFENRQLTGWDTYLPGHGMMAYRVDLSNPSVWNDYNNSVNTNPKHMYYEPLFAGGNWGGYSAYDPFPGKGNVIMLSNYTSPANLRTWAGQECKFALAHIAENDGVISFDLVDASTFAEIVLPQSQDMYKAICYHLEPQIYMPTTTYETKWTSDNPAVASVDQDGNVTAIAEGMVRITLTVDDSISATCTVSIQPAPVVPDIGTLNTVVSDIPQVLQLNNAQVCFLRTTSNQQKRVFVRDGSGSIMLSNILPDVMPGDVLDGFIYADFYNDAGRMWMTPIKGIDYTGSIQVTQGPTPEPDKVTLDNLDSCKLLDYIKMEGVTLDYRIDKQGQEQLCIVDGEHIIFLSTSYIGSMEMPTKEEMAENRYDVEAIISYYNIPGFDDSFNLTAPVTVSQKTGIEASNSSSQPLKGRIYNLHGQRINSLQRGLNILDGKKVFHPRM